VNFSQFTSIWFLYLLFSFSLITPDKFLDFSALWVRVLLWKIFFGGRPIERARHKVDFSTHEWQLGTRFSRVTRKERWNKVIPDGQKIQCHKICAQSEQKRNWALELVRQRYPPRGCSRPSCKLPLAPGYSSHLFRPFCQPLAPTISFWVSEDVFFVVVVFFYLFLILNIHCREMAIIKSEVKEHSQACWKSTFRDICAEICM